MFKQIVFFVIIFSFLNSYSYAGNEIKEKKSKKLAGKISEQAIKLKKEGHKDKRIEMTDSLSGELLEYFEKNKDASLLNDEPYDLASYIISDFLKYLRLKYDVPKKVFMSKKFIKDKKDKELYGYIVSMSNKRNMKRYLICSNDDIGKAKKIKEELNQISTKHAPKIRKHEGTTTELYALKIKRYEEVYKTCKNLKSNNMSLLSIYSSLSSGDLEIKRKFVELMLQVIKDDKVKVNYSTDLDLRDFTYSGDTHYQRYFHNLLWSNNIYDGSKTHLLSSSDIKLIAEAALIKNSYVYDVSNKNSYRNEYDYMDGIRSYIILSQYLRHYGMDELNKELFNKFVSSSDEFKRRIKLTTAVPGQEHYEYLEKLMSGTAK